MTDSGIWLARRYQNIRCIQLFACFGVQNMSSCHKLSAGSELEAREESAITFESVAFEMFGFAKPLTEIGCGKSC